MSPFDRARELILSITKSTETEQKIADFEKYRPEKLNQALEDYYQRVEEFAKEGETNQISIMIRVFDHFKQKVHDRKLLHYFAKAYANSTLRKLTTEEKMHQSDITKAVKLISEAFSDTDKLVS